MSRTPFFSIGRDQFEVQTFRAGGKGGQHQNKTESGVRIVHTASGAVGESREQRSQHDNRKTAFQRLVDTKTFQGWLKLETSRRQGFLDQVERDVATAMNPGNLRIDVKQDGHWVEEKEAGHAKEEETR